VLYSLCTHRNSAPRPVTDCSELSPITASTGPLSSDYFANFWNSTDVFKFKLFCYRRPARPGVGPPYFYYHIFITAGHLRSSYCGAPSLARGRVCNLLIQFAVALRSKSCRAHDHNLLSRVPFLSLLRLAGTNPPPHELRKAKIGCADRVSSRAAGILQYTGTTMMASFRMDVQ
jgi:hypothetical protein